MAKKIWEKILKALKSRTAWTIVAMFVVSGIDGVKDFIPSFYEPIVNAVLSLIAIYFRVNNKQ